MHGARYESARRFFNISHAMRNESVRFESTRVYMPGARLEKKKPTTTVTTGVRAVGRCHAPVIDKAGDLLGKFTRQMQNGVCLVFALPAPKAKRRTLRGGKHGNSKPKSRAKKVIYVNYFYFTSKKLFMYVAQIPELFIELLLYLSSSSSSALLIIVISIIARLRLFIFKAGLRTILVLRSTVLGGITS